MSQLTNLLQDSQQPDCVVDDHILSPKNKSVRYRKEKSVHYSDAHLQSGNFKAFL